MYTHTPRPSTSYTATSHRTSPSYKYYRKEQKWHTRNVLPNNSHTYVTYIHIHYDHNNYISNITAPTIPKTRFTKYSTPLSKITKTFKKHPRQTKTTLTPPTSQKPTPTSPTLPYTPASTYHIPPHRFFLPTKNHNCQLPQQLPFRQKPTSKYRFTSYY